MLTSVTTYSSDSLKDSRFSSVDPKNFQFNGKVNVINEYDDALDIQKRSEPNLKEHILEKGTLEYAGLI